MWCDVSSNFIWHSLKQDRLWQWGKSGAKGCAIRDLSPVYTWKRNGLDTKETRLRHSGGWGGSTVGVGALTSGTWIEVSGRQKIGSNASSQRRWSARLCTISLHGPLPFSKPFLASSAPATRHLIDSPRWVAICMLWRFFSLLSIGQFTCWHCWWRKKGPFSPSWNVPQRIAHKEWGLEQKRDNYWGNAGGCKNKNKPPHRSFAKAGH